MITEKSTSSRISQLGHSPKNLKLHIDIMKSNACVVYDHFSKSLPRNECLLVFFMGILSLDLFLNRLLSHFICFIKSHFASNLTSKSRDESISTYQVLLLHSIKQSLTIQQTTIIVQINKCRAHMYWQMWSSSQYIPMNRLPEQCIHVISVQH